MDLLSCCVVLRKFRERVSVLNDEMATISFKKDPIRVEDLAYTMQLKSKHMKTVVKNREYRAKFPKDENAKAAKYKVSLKKDIFMKFF